MTETPLQLDIRSDEDIETLIRALQLRDQLKPEWKLRPGTVAFAEGSAIMVVLDGDSEPTRVFSLIGSVFLNMRVMVLTVPQSGNFAVGFVSTIGALNPTPGQIIARGARSTQSTATDATEIGVVRVDNVAMYPGRAYVILVGNIQLGSTVANDVVLVRVRIDLAGTATTASAELGALRERVQLTGFRPILPLVTKYYHPAGDPVGVASLLLTVARATGTGDVHVAPTATQTIEITVLDVGDAPPNTGVVL